MGHCKVSQQNRGSDPEDTEGDWVLQQGHRGEGLQELEVQDLGLQKGLQIQALCWNFRTIYGGQEPSRNMVIVPARQATQAGGSYSLELIPWLHKRFKNTGSVLFIPEFP